MDSDPRLLPEYDHRDPGAGFRGLNTYIRHHLEIVVPTNTVVLDFTSAGPFFYQAPVADERCLRRARWILGVRSSIAESEQLRLVPLLAKVCSARFVPELVKRALPGMALRHLSIPPMSIRAEPDMHYYSIDTSGACWEHILQTRDVGLFLPKELGDTEFTLTAVVESSS